MTGEKGLGKISNTPIKPIVLSWFCLRNFVSELGLRQDWNADTLLGRTSPGVEIEKMRQKKKEAT